MKITITDHEGVVRDITDTLMDITVLHPTENALPPDVWDALNEQIQKNRERLAYHKEVGDGETETKR